MSLHPHFRAASEACDRLASSLSLFCDLAQRGDAKGAYTLLRVMRALVEEYGPVIEAAKEPLARAAIALGGPVRHRDSRRVTTYRHTHELILKVAERAVGVLLILPGLGGDEDPEDLEQRAKPHLDTWENYAINQSEVQAHMYHERLLVLEWAGADVHGADNRERRIPPDDPNKPRFEDATHTVYLNGESYKVEDPKAYAVFKVIAEACPHPITKAGIGAKVPGVKGKRKIPELLGTLPEPLRLRIHHGRNGYWYDGDPRPRNRAENQPKSRPKGRPKNPR